MQWNSKGYFNKLPYLHKLIDEYNPNIICLQETFLKADKRISLKQFHDPLRKEREVQNCGGV